MRQGWIEEGEENERIHFNGASEGEKIKQGDRGNRRRVREREGVVRKAGSVCGRYVNSIPATSQILVNEDENHRERKTERERPAGVTKEDPFWFIICPKRGLLLSISFSLLFVVVPDGELALCIYVGPREQ